MAKKQYRIVTDKFLGYEVQYSYWWLPFYIQLGWANTYSTISKAKEHIEHDKQTNIINKIRAEFKKCKRTVVWKE